MPPFSTPPLTSILPDHVVFAGSQMFVPGNARPLRAFQKNGPLCRSARRQPTMIKEVRFAPDSALEEIGFELVVPCRAASRQGPTNCPAIIIAVDDRNYLQT